MKRPKVVAEVPPLLVLIAVSVASAALVALLVLLGPSVDAAKPAYSSEAAAGNDTKECSSPLVSMPGQLTVQAQECSPTVAGAIRVTFVWTPAISGPQWLDLSLSDNGFAPGTFVGIGPLAANEQVFAWDGLRPAATHYVRLDTLHSGYWYPSGTLVFRTGICGGPALLGSLSESCNLFTSDTTFSWTPAVTQGSEQWLDISVYNNGFAPGTFISAGPLPQNVTWFTWKGLSSGTTHYWRVNTLTSAGWNSSATESFLTGCAPPPQRGCPPTCCKCCAIGKACGDTCIGRSYTCPVAPGCACNGW